MSSVVPPLSPETSSARRAAMAALTRAEHSELEAPLARRWGDIDVRDLRAPEIGLVMVQGRIGGDGAPFNMGEATVTRAVVELPGGLRGYGQRLGSDKETTRLAAVVDALWQDTDARSLVEAEILTPIRRRIAAEAALKKAETAATKVDFFTLVRGESEA